METNVSMETNDPDDQNNPGKENLDLYDETLASEAVDSLQLQLKDFGPKVDLAKPDDVVLMDFSLEKTLAELEKEDWYHGCLPFEDILGLLKNDGDFLIRELEPEGDRHAMACITGRWEGKVRDYPIHHMVHNNEHIYTLDGTNKCNNIMTLVKLHHSAQIPIGDTFTLGRPVCKQPWELTSEKVKMITKIGAGAYGEVWHGVMHESPNKPSFDVAIKVKKINAENKAMMDEMYKEARLMRQYKHKNVVTFYGVVQEGNGNVMIVMEFVNGGSLKEHLRKTKDIPVKTKVGYACDVAVGLVYLHSKGCMHRDIACRNCLIDVKKSIVKISDFGLSKQAETYHIPDSEKLAIKWQAPEVILTRTYTMKSDVYSFAILLWEIFNDGDSPFAGVKNRTIRLKISDPKFRPLIGPNLPILIVRVMKTCWRGDPNKRPMMAQVARYLIHAPPEFLLPRPPTSPSSSKTISPAKAKCNKESTDQRPSASLSKASAQAYGSTSKASQRLSASSSKASENVLPSPKARPQENVPPSPKARPQENVPPSPKARPLVRKTQSNLSSFRRQLRDGVMKSKSTFKAWSS